MFIRRNFNLTSCLLCCLLPVSAASAFESAVKISCQRAMSEQLDAVLLVVNAVAKSCRQLNYELNAKGFPHCGSLCTDKALASISGLNIEISYRIGDEKGSMDSGSFPYPGGGTNFPQATDLLSLKPKESEEEYLSSPMPSIESALLSSADQTSWQISLTLKVPLTPTRTVECSNPFSSPIVASFADQFLKSEWAAKKFQQSCSHVRE